MIEKETPAAMGRRLAEKTAAEMAQMMPLINAVSALDACLHELIELLITKNVLSPQETLDAFARASGEIQAVGGETSGVETVERICKRIAALPGAKRLAT